MARARHADQQQANAPGQRQHADHQKPALQVRHRQPPQPLRRQDHHPRGRRPAPPRTGQAVAQPRQPCQPQHRQAALGGKPRNVLGLRRRRPAAVGPVPAVAQRLPPDRLPALAPARGRSVGRLPAGHARRGCMSTRGLRFQCAGFRFYGVGPVVYLGPVAGPEDRGRKWEDRVARPARVSRQIGQQHRGRGQHHHRPAPPAQALPPSSRRVRERAGGRGRRWGRVATNLGRGCCAGVT